jgi:hypothetical protein
MGRTRDAGTGAFVSKDEGRRRPKETVSERARPPEYPILADLAALEARVARLEQAVTLGEAGARALYGDGC